MSNAEVKNSLRTSSEIEAGKIVQQQVRAPLEISFENSFEKKTLAVLLMTAIDQVLIEECKLIIQSMEQLDAISASDQHQLMIIDLKNEVFNSRLFIFLKGSGILALLRFLVGDQNKEESTNPLIIAQLNQMAFEKFVKSLATHLQNSLAIEYSNLSVGPIEYHSTVPFLQMNTQVTYKNSILINVITGNKEEFIFRWDTPDKLQFDKFKINEEKKLRQALFYFNKSNNLCKYIVPGYIPLSVNDFLKNEKIEFDLFLFLPKNKKMLLYRPKDEILESAFIEKAQDENSNVSLYIPESQKNKFIDFSSAKIGKLIKSNSLEPSKKVQVISKQIGTLLQSFFSSPDEITSKNLDLLYEVSNSLISQIVDSKHPFHELLGLMKTMEGGAQGHAQNVQALCTFFMLAMGYTNSKALSDMGIASFFHDIGLSKIPPECSNLPYESLSPELRTQYQTHPAIAVDLIHQKTKKISTETLMIIQQHHEKVDGSGFPNGLKGIHTYNLAKLFAVVDTLEDIMRAPFGGEPKNLLDGFLELKNLYGPKSPESRASVLDFKFLEQIEGILFHYKDK